MTKPRGVLVPIGGGEDGEDILDRILKETGRRKQQICSRTQILQRYPTGDPITVEGITMHVLGPGRAFFNKWKRTDRKKKQARPSSAI